MIFGIPKTIAFLSQGTTLEKGTIIMTGTFIILNKPYIHIHITLGDLAPKPAERISYVSG
jgi:2-keto-4-pentenoate hydratase/2-oxohepta-3-ene-1,7-dioic acid hydratase in catechol pathway